jgi:hypothetical protein
MARLNIIRNTKWNSRLRNIEIYLDGEKIGAIANWRNKEFIIPPGRHSIKGKIDWCGSNNLDFSASDDETVNLKLCSFKYENYVMIASVIIPALYFITKHFFNLNIFMWPVFALLFFYIYYLTFGRNKLLRIIRY